MRVETERLIIDEIREEDRENYFRNISHDKEVLKTFICTYQENLETFVFNKYLGRSDLFAIRTRDNGELIGIFVECEVDKEKKSLEIGYGIGSSYWGHGFMTETVSAMISYYFEQTEFTTIFASFFPENTASKRVMEKCKMTFSHVSEKELTYLGQERDLIYYRISKDCGFLDYYRNNTDLEIADIFKFMYQSCFGCEHLVSDYNTALNWITKEAESAALDDLPDVEYLDGEYCRVHLKALDAEHSAEWLCRAFLDSSQTHTEGQARLENQLQTLHKYVSDGLIGFDIKQLEYETETWRKQGFPAIHHSELFRNTHHPAYRVILKKYLLL